MTRRSRIAVQVGVVVLLLAAGGAILAHLVLSKTPPTRKKPQVQAPMVRTITAQTGPLQVTVSGEGSAQPLHMATLAAEVSGRVLSLSPSLVDGGSFKKGQVLLTIDQADYELALTLSHAGVEEAEAALEVAKEEAEAGKQEWRLLQKDSKQPLSEAPPLVAKTPQLEYSRAKLEAAKAQVRQARLALERTHIRAPFNGRVIKKSVDLGQYLTPGKAVAEVFSTETAVIYVYLEDADLTWLKVPGLTSGSGQGSPAVVKAQFAGRSLSWPGRITRALGSLDERTRLVGVVVEVAKPYAKLPPLAVGMFVKVEIKGMSLDSATILPRTALHQGNLVWLVDDQGRLRFTKVKVARLQGAQALLSPGLPNGAKVVTSPLKAVSDGMAVRLAPVED
jgi:RND family efflux transporter MFP subunit